MNQKGLVRVAIDEALLEFDKSATEKVFNKLAVTTSAAYQIALRIQNI